MKRGITYDYKCITTIICNNVCSHLGRFWQASGGNHFEFTKTSHSISYTLSIIISKSVGHADNFHFTNTTNDTEFRFEIHLSVRESDALR